jgi:hypothetical protein
MKYALVAMIAVLITGAGYWFSIHERPHADAHAETVSASAQEAAVPEVPLTDVPKDPAPSLGPTYTNKKFRFSVEMPADFKASELPPEDDGGASTILLQNQKGDGIQIQITPVKNAPRELTADDVRLSIPDLKIGDEQIVEIGNNNKGVAFLSNNDAFGGHSREVWFYFGNNLYQISTYARLDPLLKSMFATWKFF